MDAPQQLFGVDHVYESAFSHHHQPYGPAPANVWPFPQQSSSGPIDPSSMYPISLGSAQPNVAHYSSTSVPTYYGANDQSADHVHGRPLDPSHSLNLTGPSIDSLVGPRRVTSRRRASQNEVASSSHPMHRQRAVEQRQVHESQNVFFPLSYSSSRQSSPQDLIPSADYNTTTGLSLGGSIDAREHALGHAPASRPPSTEVAPGKVSRQAKAGSSLRNLAPSPTLSAASARTSTSSGSGSAQATFTDGSCPPPPPPPPPPSAPNKQHKHRLYNTDRRDICAYARDNPDARQEDIARKWGVERSTISKILKHKARWLSIKPDETMMITKDRCRKFPQIEACLKDWLLQCHENRTAISDAMIREEALRIAAEFNISRDVFKASSGWIEDFKTLYGVSGGVWHGNGTVNLKSSAAGEFHLEPARICWGPSFPDIIKATGAYPLETVSENTIPDDSAALFTSRDLIKMTGSRTFMEAYEKLERWKKENPDREPMWSILRPHAAFSAQEDTFEKQAVMVAELEARRLAREARDAGKLDEFNFKNVFYRLVKGALRGLPEAYTYGQPFPIRPRGSHPDDIPECPGPSVEDALEAVLKVLSFASIRQPDFLPEEHMAGLYHVYRAIGIITDRERRRMARIGKVEEIANTLDPCGECIAERVPPFRNPTVDEALAQLSEISGMTPDEVLESRNRVLA